MLRFCCPFCAQLLAAPPDAAGRVMTCTHCRQLLTIPHLPPPAPVPITHSPSPRTRRTTALSVSRDYVCPKCGSGRRGSPGAGPPQCARCPHPRVMVKHLEFVLDRDSYFEAFLNRGMHLHYTPEAERLANGFVDLCVEIAARGVPAAVVVAGELAKVEDDGDLQTGPPARRAFLRSVPFYELLYEELMRSPSEDPAWGLRRDVLEAIFDHPHFRTAPRNADHTFDRPPIDPAQLPVADYGYTRNVFEEAEDDETRSRRQVRKQARDDTLIRLVVLPLVVVAALVGLFFSLDIPDQAAALQRIVLLVCLLVGAAALFGFVFWDSL